MKYKIEMKVTLPDVPIGRRYADMLERLETRQNRFVDRQEGCGEIVIDLLYHSDLPEIEIPNGKD